MEQDVHEYTGEGIEVSYDVLRCIHARECVRGLPSVFDTSKRPWVDLTDADADEVASVIGRCPTGALHFERGDGPAEPVPETNTVTVTPNGPLYLRGDVEITTPDDDVLLTDTRVALCRCGMSTNKPLCDNSHVDVEFEAAGTVEADQEEVDVAPPEGTLRVIPTKNGPLHLEGEFEIEGQSDGSTYRDDDAWLCRCGGSGTKPFCDGTHRRIGFSTEE